ncbi:MAG: hypothetical protein Q8933_09345 [Bacteroidota bacterium]|nr:hypothetical protein [Bacteroidota bacterium]
MNVMVLVKCSKCGEIKKIKTTFAGLLYCETCDECFEIEDAEFIEKEVYELVNNK